ncbi:MAG: PilZ domain-containing protein [Gemmataceae bacterium]|nr:PilZ domain-containing protein [Gemmataceae bacterium]
MSAPTLAPTSERRTGLRQPTRSRQQCKLIRNNGDGPWQATIRNVSPDGIGLIANQRFKRGMFITVELPTKKGALAKLMKVTHAAEQPGGVWWVLGGVFASKLTSEEMTSLL